MGVRHLETFMTKNLPNGFLETNLLDEIRRYVKERGEKPIILLDLVATSIHFYHNRVENFYGGRHLKYLDHVNRFFLEVTSAGAEVVSFLDGALQDQKIEVRLSRQDQNYPYIVEVLDQIYENLPLSEVSSNIKTFILTLTWLPIISHAAKLFGKLHVSVHNETDTEIAKFAVNNPRVLALIADDSDFLIYPGSWRYFSLKYMDMETLDTFEYDRQALREFLQLNDQQLILLSTIAGNDIIAYERICKFHREFGHQSKKKFPAMAKYIKEKMSENQEENVQHIGQVILKDRHWETFRRIQESFDLYDINYEERDPHFSPLMQFCCENHQEIYYILTGSVSTFIAAYSDLRRTDLPTSNNLCIPLLKRQAGIILFHLKPSLGRILIRFMAKKSHEEPYEIHHTSPVYPDEINNLSLLQLLKREEFPELDHLRFQLLFWMIGDGKLGVHDLMNVPRNLRAYIMILVHMKAKNAITDEEAELFLLSLIEKSDKKLDDRDYLCTQILDGRAFRLSFLFACLHCKIMLAFEIVGLKNLTEQIDYDGAKFHMLYNENQLQKLEMPDSVRRCDYRWYEKISDNRENLVSE